MSKFFDFDSNEYKYKILVYPNITYQKDMECDSYVVVLSNIIKVLNSIRDDLHFTVVTPKPTQNIGKFENVREVIYKLPSYPNAMRTHFDYFDLQRIVNWQDNEFDIVYSHLPEHTLQLSNLFFNNTNIRPKFIGYSHWYEIEENTHYLKSLFMNNIAGTLEMEEVGVNSIWLKNLILSKATKYYNEEVISKLNKILQPHYLGVDNINIKSGANNQEKIILFNHRENEYTGFKWFVKKMDEMWEVRKDFKVKFTLVNSIDKEWAIPCKQMVSDREQYLKSISNVLVGVGTFGKYSAWSISVTDGLSQGIPYILPNKLVYPEMLGDSYPLFYNSKKEFMAVLNKVLDDSSIVNDAKVYIEKIIQSFTWENRVKKWFNNWKIFEFDVGTKTESYYKILKFIKSQKSVSKKQILEYMGWGVRIPFTPYRHLLRLEPDIRFTESHYELRD